MNKIDELEAAIVASFKQISGIRHCQARAPDYFAMFADKRVSLALPAVYVALREMKVDYDNATMHIPVNTVWQALIIDGVRKNSDANQSARQLAVLIAEKAHKSNFGVTNVYPAKLQTIQLADISELLQHSVVCYEVTWEQGLYLGNDEAMQ